MSDLAGSLPDPLAQFRAQGARDARPTPPRPPETRYRAFGTTKDGTRAVRLDVRPKHGTAVARLYSQIAEIAYDRGEYTGILLVLPGKLVKIRGRNLQPVVEALLDGTCAYLAERPDGELADEGAPSIDRIETLAPQATTS